MEDSRTTGGRQQVIRRKSDLRFQGAEGSFFINTEHKEYTRIVVISYVCSLNLPSCGANMCSSTLSKSKTTSRGFW